MSDLCHCADPQVVRSVEGVLYCRNCGLWYVKEEWEKDPRVRRNQATIDEMVKLIMKKGGK